MRVGEYVIREAEPQFNLPRCAFIAEVCPACNGGKKVGGLGSNTTNCPVCAMGIGSVDSSGVVMVEVPIDEAQRWLDEEARKLRVDSDG